MSDNVMALPTCLPGSNATTMDGLGQLYSFIPGESGPLKMVSGMVAISMFFACVVGVWSCFGLPTDFLSWVGEIIGLSRIPSRLEAAKRNARGRYNYWKTHFNIRNILHLRFIGNEMIPAVMNFPHKEFFDKHDDEGNVTKEGSWLPTTIWMLGLWAWHMFITIGALAFMYVIYSGEGMLGHTTEWWVYHVAYYWLSEFGVVLPICFIHYHIEENDWFRYYKIIDTQPSQELRRAIWNTYIGKMFNIGYRFSHLAFLICCGLLTDASLEPTFFTWLWVAGVFRWFFMFYFRWFSTHVHHQSMHTQKDENLPTDGRQFGRLQYYCRHIWDGGLSLFGSCKYFGWNHLVHHKWIRDLMALANEDASMEDNLTAVIILNFIPPVLTCCLFGPLSIDQFILVNCWNNYIAFDAHTNYDLPFKPMRVIPGIHDFTRFHSFHHSSRGGDDHGLAPQADGHRGGDGGSAFSISIIDWMFGTYAKYEKWETRRLKAEANPLCSYNGGPVDHDYEVPQADRALPDVCHRCHTRCGGMASLPGDIPCPVLVQLSGYGGPSPRYDSSPGAERKMDA